MSATPAENPARSEAVIRRFRMATVCAALTALTILQDPGAIVADTKVDLVVDPLRFLGRSLSLWDASASFGQANDQTVGYLWPMGPFFLLGDVLGLPDWVVQRLWWALVMSVAFTGVATLARRMKIGTPGTRILAGIAFALCPRIISEIGSNSVEAWPTAIAPWVLVPLIPLAEGARLRRPITLSALVVACAGGVNATAVLAVVPLPLMWLATLHPVRRRFTALIAWFFAMLFATSWWLAPLLLLGRYATPFLNYTESAEVTTRITDAITVLRGTSHWVAHLGDYFGPAWPAGARLVTEPALIVATLAVAGLGVIGLSLHGIPRRGFLISSLVVGVALVSLGHVSDLPMTFADLQRDFLNGIGAPLRNVHKFDVVLRLPLMLGLAHALGLVSRFGSVVRKGMRPSRPVAAIVLAGATAAILGVATPALAAELAPEGGYAGVPQYWRDAAAWLNTNAPPDRVLIIPGAAFPHYTWGTTGDEIAQPLLTSEWAVRNIIPLAPAGTIRMLDAVENVLQTGTGSAGLADLLARSGVKYLLVRSDLDYGRTGALRPITVNQAVSRSPGLTLVHSFGPAIGGDRSFFVVRDHGLDVPVRALDLYRVDRTTQSVAVYDASDVTTVVGGPESLLAMSADRQLSGAPTIMAGDLGGRAPPGPVVITDDLRRREISFGALHDNASQTLRGDEPYAISAAAHDYLPAGWESQLTVARYSGIDSVTASSAASLPVSIGGSRPEHQPFAAIDSDLGTSWRPSPGLAPEKQWIQFELARPQPVGKVHIVFDPTADSLPTQITVDVDGVQAIGRALAVTEMDIDLPATRNASTIRLTINSVAGIGQRFGSFGISEVSIPSLETGRTLVTPAPPATANPASVVLSAAPSVPACYFVADRPYCNASAARASEDGEILDRTVNLPAAGDYIPTLWARPRPGPALNAVLDRELAKQNPLGIIPDVASSSSAVNEPAGRPGIMIDGDPHTFWSPAPDDASPFVRITFLSRRSVSGIQLITTDDMAATRPGVLRVLADGGQVRGGLVDANGVLDFGEPLTTTSLTIMFTPPPPVADMDPYTLAQDSLPIGVGEIIVRPALGANPAFDLDRAVELPCGSGPQMSLGDISLKTRLTGTRRDLVQLREMRAVLCGDGSDEPASLSAGEQHIVVRASSLAVPARLSLDPGDGAAEATASPLRIDSWSGSVRQIAVAPGATDRIIAVRENTNPGWRATVDGQPLEPIILDGWQQGWILPAGIGGEVIFRFAADSLYRQGVLFGALLLLVLFVMVVWPVPKYGAHARGPAWAPARRTDRLAALAIGSAGLILVGGIGGAIVALAGVLLAFYRSLFPRPSMMPGTRALLRAVQLGVSVALLAIGGWLSRVGYNEHALLGPQVAGLLCVSTLWLSVVAQPASARSRREVHQRPLQRVVRERRQRQRDDQRQPEGAGHVASEERLVLENVDLLDHERMP